MKKKSWFRRMAGLGRVGFLLGAMAQATAAAMAAPPPGPLDSKIELAVTEANPEELFATLGKLMGAEVVLEPGLTGTMASKVSIELHNVRVRTILDALCESVGCQWALDSSAKPPKLRVTPGPVELRPDSLGKHALPKEPIDLRVTDAEVQDVLRTFGQILGGKAIIDPAIKGTVSLDLQDTPCDEALSAVCTVARCDWTYDAAARVLRVTSLSNVKRK